MQHHAGVVEQVVHHGGVVVEAVAPDRHGQPGLPDRRPVLGADVQPVGEHDVGADGGDRVGQVAAVQGRVGLVGHGDA